MVESNKIVIAAKCPPQEKLLEDVVKAGINAVELYLSEEFLKNLKKVVSICRTFPLRYAIHAPTDGSNISNLIEIVKLINAEIVVFHDVYWEDEWKEIVTSFKNINTKLCVENTCNVHEPLKFIRRYGLSRCLDMEHLLMQCAGIYEEEFIKVIKQTSHVHLTGYIYGGELWHTHIHHSPEQSMVLLDLLKRSAYSGLVVSEASVSLQTYEEFKKLNEFFQMWKESRSK